MMPRLEAEQDMAWLQRYRVAAAMVEEPDQKQYVDGLRRMIGVRRQRQTKAEAMANFAAIGIPIIEE